MKIKFWYKNIYIFLHPFCWKCENRDWYICPFKEGSNNERLSIVCGVKRLILNINYFIQIRILKRNCLNCNNIKKVKVPTIFHKQWFCSNAMNFDGLIEPTKTSICKKYKRKIKYLVGSPQEEVDKIMNSVKIEINGKQLERIKIIVCLKPENYNCDFYNNGNCLDTILDPERCSYREDSPWNDKNEKN